MHISRIPKIYHLRRVICWQLFVGKKINGGWHVITQAEREWSPYHMSKLYAFTLS